eukprot:CAMPEP_0196591980 /NCGR_PEP_ID=MMETSP1081-20130531/71483_1 /TAXON_ID=36882 /ORGANISM="Pyramimonas amylifera, Strain CCMP720" /LENGTH=99 /DNA_ID=CAMNT_0041915527 /DNA_START=138 /DNA_END=434 /DNA_ORIENTATION=+
MSKRPSVEGLLVDLNPQCRGLVERESNPIIKKRRVGTLEEAGEKSEEQACEKLKEDTGKKVSEDAIQYLNKNASEVTAGSASAGTPPGIDMSSSGEKAA